jgi:hypothetical protein
VCARIAYVFGTLTGRTRLLRTVEAGALVARSRSQATQLRRAQQMLFYVPALCVFFVGISASARIFYNSICVLPYMWLTNLSAHITSLRDLSAK